MTSKIFVSVFFLSVSLASLADNNPLDSTDINIKENHNIFHRIIKYFDESNEEKPQKKFDLSFIGGPHYSNDTKLGLGLVAAGLYRTVAGDSLLPQSNVSLFADISTVGFYMIGIRGNNIFPANKYRLSYTLYFYSFPTKFWGIGYDNGNNKENETKYDHFQAKISAEFMITVAHNFYIGPLFAFDYNLAKHIERPELWMGQNRITTNLCLGASIRYDTRDHLTNPYKGICLQVDQYFRPRFLGNDYAFSSTEFTAKYYTTLWKGGVLASQLHALLEYGNPPWGLMAKLGGNSTMRGYYEGRYRDKDEIDLTFELRQHVWRRNGVVVWVGAGTVFPKFSEMRFHEILPNYGIGYRWEFKKRTNVRLDLGFGKKQTGFIFNINEAF